jgi:hypothetical protein
MRTSRSFFAKLISLKRDSLAVYLSTNGVVVRQLSSNLSPRFAIQSLLRPRRLRGSAEHFSKSTRVELFFPKCFNFRSNLGSYEIFSAQKRCCCFGSTAQYWRPTHHHRRFSYVRTFS